MRISDWSSDMCSSDLVARERPHIGALAAVNLEDCVIAVRLAFQGDGMDCDAARLQLEVGLGAGEVVGAPATHLDGRIERRDLLDLAGELRQHGADLRGLWPVRVLFDRSEEHTSELQSLMRI